MPAELAIRIKDKNSLDPDKDRVLGKEGDIIVAISDERIKQVWCEMICRGRWTGVSPLHRNFGEGDPLFDEYMQATNNRRKRLVGLELDDFWNDYVALSGLLELLGNDPTGKKSCWEAWPWGTMETKNYFCVYVSAATKEECVEWVKPIVEQVGIDPDSGQAITRTLAKRQYKFDFRNRISEMGLSAKTLTDIDNPDLDVFTKFDVSDYKQFIESKI